MRNLSYENEFYSQVHSNANHTHFHMKDFALGLGLKQRQNATRKWPIKTPRCLYPPNRRPPPGVPTSTSERAGKPRKMFKIPGEPRDGLTSYPVGVVIHARALLLLNREFKQLLRLRQRERPLKSITSRELNSVAIIPTR